MIFDSIANRDTYRALSPRIAAALDYCAAAAAAGFSEKTVELEGRAVYAMHQFYQTAGEAGREYETHKKYVDVQYLLEGEEIIRVVDAEGLTTTKPYDEEKDCAFHAAVPGIDVRLRPGDFAVLWPQDAHMPKLAAGKSAAVKKVVVKVRLE